MNGILVQRVKVTGLYSVCPQSNWLSAPDGILQFRNNSQRPQFIQKPSHPEVVSEDDCYDTLDTTVEDFLEHHLDGRQRDS